MDEKGCAKALKEYIEAVKKYDLDAVADGHSQSTQRYMSDSFIAGFYAGRDHQRQKKG